MRVCAPGAEVGDVELLEWLTPKLARYKVPKELIEWPALPKSAYGKVIKRTIRDELIATGWTAPE